MHPFHVTVVKRWSCNYVRNECKINVSIPKRLKRSVQTIHIASALFIHPSCVSCLSLLWITIYKNGLFSPNLVIHLNSVNDERFNSFRQAIEIKLSLFLVYFKPSTRSEILPSFLHIDVIHMSR